MDALVQHLLASRSPRGTERLCQYSIIDAVAVYAPYTSVTFQFAPPIGTYAYIAFNYRESPYIVPGALRLEAWQAGIQFFNEILGGTITEEPHTMWVVITEKEPSLTRITNLTGLQQEEEFMQEGLLVQSEDDYKVVLQAIRDWGNYGVIEAIRKLPQQVGG